MGNKFKHGTSYNISMEQEMKNQIIQDAITILGVDNGSAMAVLYIQCGMDVYKKFGSNWQAEINNIARPEWVDEILNRLNNMTAIEQEQAIDEIKNTVSIGGGMLE